MKIKHAAVLFILLSLALSNGEPIMAQGLDRASLSAAVDGIAAEALKAGPVAGLSIM